MEDFKTWLNYVSSGIIGVAVIMGTILIPVGLAVTGHFISSIIAFTIVLGIHVGTSKYYENEED